MAGAKTDYDLVIAGGGLAGSALAIVMARNGHRVLVVERETRFRDRIRGELLLPWGSREAKRLGLYDDLVARCALEGPFWSFFAAGAFVRARDLKATTPDGSCCLTLPHPAMQETLLSLAQAAGVQILRGIALDHVVAGSPPSVSVAIDGATRPVSSRLVVLAEGRESRLRRALGFAVKADPEFILIGGMLLHGSNELGRRVDGNDDGTTRGVHSFYDPVGLRYVIALTVAEHLSRVYLIHHKDVLPRRLSGARDLSEAIGHLRAVGAPERWFEGVELAGPFSTFDGAARWVEHPYRNGVVLIGDAAGATDPTWGEGLARTLRDVRLLRDRLLSDDDWDRAASAFAADHDAFFSCMLRLGGMRGELLFSVGPEADARRKRAFAAHKADPAAMPDILAYGPDAPSDDAAKARYFGEA
jgi:2-polyprenyl-6-methoxyphenol hydroxylase-like FAD-dependent oxidoreductase